MNDLLISFYGDDFTGSTDAMESLTLAGVPTLLFLDPPDAGRLARYPGLGAVGVAGVTRSLPPDAMEAELRPALTKLKALGAPVVHYKVCSTFDSSPTVGSVGRAIDVGRDVFREAPFVPLLVAAPLLGRYCVFGNLFAKFGREPEPFRLDRHPSMSRHPVTPADESDLRLVLARQTDQRTALFDILKLNLPDHAQRQAALDEILSQRPGVVLFDLLYENQLPAVGRLIHRFASWERPLFVVGSSAVETALGAGAWKEFARSSHTLPSAGPAGPLLAVSGSCSPVTRRQIEWALSQGFTEVALGGCDEAVELLNAGRHVIVHTLRNGSPEKNVPPGVFGEALGQVVRAAVARANVRRVLIAGGDTSGYLARSLGIETLEMIAPLAPGAPLCRARAVATAGPIDGLELNFKGGQVGGPDYFGAVAAGRQT